MRDREPFQDPTPDELLTDLTDLFNDLQMAAAPRAYSTAVLHCMAAVRAAVISTGPATSRRQRWPMDGRVVPFNRPLTYGRAMR
jgi:hypothetical protein